MIVKGAFEKAKSYIESHSGKAKEEGNKNISGPCITISREAGAGAEVVSQLIVDTFSELSMEKSWTIFDSNLIEKVLQDHNLPMRLSKIMEERKYSAVRSIMNEMIGGQPGLWTLFHKTTETILQLAHIGFCIIVERGGNIVTAQMDNCLHVRLIASEEDKIKHVMEIYNFSRKDAVDYIKKEDENRKEYIQAYFHKNIEDPQLYHFIINTSEMTYAKTADLICDAVMKKFPEFFSREELNTFSRIL